MEGEEGTAHKGSKETDVGEGKKEETQQTTEVEIEKGKEPEGQVEKRKKAQGEKVRKKKSDKEGGKLKSEPERSFLAINSPGLQPRVESRA